MLALISPAGHGPQASTVGPPVPSTSSHSHHMGPPALRLSPHSLFMSSRLTLSPFTLSPFRTSCSWLWLHQSVPENQQQCPVVQLPSPPPSRQKARLPSQDFMLAHGVACWGRGLPDTHHPVLERGWRGWTVICSGDSSPWVFFMQPLPLSSPHSPLPPRPPDLAPLGSKRLLPAYWGFIKGAFRVFPGRFHDFCNPGPRAGENTAIFS